MKYKYKQKGGYKSPAWTRKAGQSPTGGLNAKGRASAKAEGSNLKSQLSSGTSPRRVSFAARFAGMKGPMKKPNGEPTRKALALKKWGFGSVEAARNFANSNKKSAQMGGAKVGVGQGYLDQLNASKNTPIPDYSNMGSIGEIERAQKSGGSGSGSDGRPGRASSERFDYKNKYQRRKANVERVQGFDATKRQTRLMKKGKFGRAETIAARNNRRMEKFGNTQSGFRNFFRRNKKEDGGVRQYQMAGALGGGGSDPMLQTQAYNPVISQGATSNQGQIAALQAQQAELSGAAAGQNIQDQANLQGAQAEGAAGGAMGGLQQLGDASGMVGSQGMQMAGGAAGMAGSLIGAAADDNDATTMTGGEVGGAALKGAAAGAMFGPIGAGVGALVGVAGGLIGRKKARKEEARLEEEQQEKKDKVNTKLAAAEADDLTYSGYDQGRPSGVVKAMYGGRKFQTGGNDFMSMVAKGRENMSPEQKEAIQNTGTITEGPSFMERMKSKASKMYDKYAPALVKDSPAIAKYAKDNPLDAAQVGLGALAVGADAIPVVGNTVSAGADLLNAGISGGRSAYYANKGDKGKAGFYAGLAGMDLAAIAPGAGNVAGLGKIGKLVNQAAKGNTIAKTAHAAHIANKGVTALKAADVASKGNILSGISTKDKPEEIAANLKTKGVQKSQMGGARNLPGGMVKSIPGSDAVEFKGNTHAEGGIMMDSQTEVEDKETMDKVTMKKGGKKDYFFSSYLKRGGRSFADMHKDVLKKGGGQKEVDLLAKMQEHDAGRNTQSVKAEMGGVKKMQFGGTDYDSSTAGLFEGLSLSNNSGSSGGGGGTGFFGGIKESFNDKIDALKDKVKDYKEGAGERQKQRALNQMYKDTPDIALAAGAAQMIPAMYAFKHKEADVEKRSMQGELSAPDLERVNFNAERAANEAGSRAINRFIETSGGGPANIAAKMAAYSKKQDQDMKIAAAEERANTGIGNQEATLRMNAKARNIANRMTVNAANTTALENQRLRVENNKKEAIDVAMKNVAGLASDVMQYKADGDYARAIGNMGIDERQKLRSALKGQVNKATGELWTDEEISALYKEATGKE